ncbi:hypothetical protein LCGC14_2363960, partial [marine sediment metagenome]
VAAGAAGGIVGSFRYRSANIDSAGVVGPASVATDVLTVEDNKIDLSSITLGAGGARLYRDTADGTTFFWLADVTTNAFTDDIDDRTLLTSGKEPPNHGDPPPAGARFGMQHRALPLYLGTDARPNDFWYGDAGRGDSVPSDNHDPVGEGEEGDHLVTGWPEYEGIAVLFKEQSIWTLAGDGRNTFNLERSQAQAGTVGKNSVALVPGGLKFRDSTGETLTIGKPVLAYLTPHGDARIFDGLADLIISSGAKDTFATMDYQYRDQAWVRIYPPYHWIIFAIPTGDQTFTYMALDYTLGSWHKQDFLPNAACASLAETASANNVLLCGQAKTSVGGKVYQFFTGSTADGSNITSTIRTIPLHHGKPLDLQWLRAVGSIFEAQASALTVTLNVYAGMADTGATAFSTHSLELLNTNAEFTELDPAQIKDSNGVYSRAKSHVLEWTRTGTTEWGMAGWETYRQDEPQAYAVTS